MNSPEKIGLKLILDYLIDSNNIALRRKALAFVLEFLAANDMDVKKAEEAIKAELQADLKTANTWMKRISLDLDAEQTSQPTEHQ